MYTNQLLQGENVDLLTFFNALTCRQMQDFWNVNLKTSSNIIFRERLPMFVRDNSFMDFVMLLGLRVALKVSAHLATRTR